MALNEQQQAINALQNAKHVLITFPAGHSGDAVGSSLALALYLEKLGKKVDIISSNFQLPGFLRFLPNSERIANEVAALRKFIITLNLQNAPLQDLSYSVETNKLHIYLTPKQGEFTSSDVTTQTSNFTHDLIITTDTADLESLGEIYHNNTQFFFQTTILNIDHSPANEHFGQINLVDFNVPSTADVIFDLIEAMSPNVVDENIATCLFAALTSASKSFSSTQVTPETLGRAAKLVSLGARREEVVTHLYRTKKLATLKLWGRALARLKSDSSRKLVWTLLQPDDFIKAGAGQEDLPGVIDDLITNAPEAGTIALLYEVSINETNVFLHAGPGQHALDLLKPFDPQGDKRRATAILKNKGVLEGEKLIIEHLKQLIRPLE